MFTIDEYRSKVQSLVNLPTLPIIATEIIRIIQEDKLSINQMLPIIEKDPPLALKVLKFANSPFYGLMEKVKSLRHAMVIVGVEQLGQLAMTFSVIRVLQDDGNGEHIPWRLFWEHSSACGYIAQLLHESLGISTITNPYSLGLLHDIGKLVFYKIDPNTYTMIYNYCQENKIAGYKAEHEVAGLTHPEIGMWLAEKWGLPTSISRVIANHHNPAEMEEAELTTSATVIALADQITNSLNINFGSAEPPGQPELSEGWKILKNNHKIRDDEQLIQFIDKIQNQRDGIREMVQLLRK
jgi:putative nucleotidyltransferase with HDIG domain